MANFRGAGGTLYAVLVLSIMSASSGSAEPPSDAQAGSTCDRRSEGVFVSFVTVSRIDSYRGDMAMRLTNFVELVVHNCAFFRVRCEVLVIEWNPLKGHRRIVSVLREARHLNKTSVVPVRVLTVPAEFHASVEAGTGQSFLEFIGKNVGGRRAHGDVILFTNADDIFSPDMFRFLALEKMDRDAFFRTPRVDIKRSFHPHRTVQERASALSEQIAGFDAKSLDAFFCKGLGEHENCMGRYNLGICERGFLGMERHDEHFGLGDPLYFAAAGDFFMTHRSNIHALGGYPQVASTVHVDSFLMCKASGAGLRQIVLLPPCTMFHQRHEAFDPDGVVISESCPEGGIDVEGRACRRRFVHPEWVPSDKRCEEIASEVADSLRGWVPGSTTEPGGVSYDPSWGFPDVVFEEVLVY